MSPCRGSGQGLAARACPGTGQPVGARPAPATGIRHFHGDRPRLGRGLGRRTSLALQGRWPGRAGLQELEAWPAAAALGPRGGLTALGGCRGVLGCAGSWPVGWVGIRQG